MSLSAVLPLLSVAALIASFLILLAKPESNRARWRKIVTLAGVFLFLSMAVEIGKWKIEKNHEEDSKKTSNEQHATNLQLLSEIQELYRTAASAFRHLDETIKSLPDSTVAVDLRKQAVQVRDQLNTLTAIAGNGTGGAANLSELKSLIDETQAGIQNLNAAILKIEGTKQEPLIRTPNTQLGREVESIRQAILPPPQSAVIPEGPPIPAVARSIESSLVVVASLTGTTADRSVVRLNIETEGFLPKAFGSNSVESSIKIDTHSDEGPHSSPFCQKITFSPRRPDEWAAIAWLFPEGNWGDVRGKDWSQHGFKKVSFWAKSVKRPEVRYAEVQFSAGATERTKKYPSSFQVDGPTLKLTQDWKEYSIDLGGKNLSQVNVGLIMVFKDNPSPSFSAVCIDDIEYR